MGRINTRVQYSIDYRVIDERVAALRHAVIFRDLLHEDLLLLARAAQRRSYGRRGIIEPSEESDTIYVVACGRVRLYLISDEGRELTLFTRREGQLFELAAVGDELPGEAIAEASESDTIVYALPWSNFLEIVAFRPGAVGSLAELLREGLLQERRLIAELAFHNMRRRLGRQLVLLTEHCDDAILSVSREELAAHVGTRPEEVSRALRQFLDEQLIYYRPHGRTIAIINKERLLDY
jgi:CRP/FNR family transcriptional regulator